MNDQASTSKTNTFNQVPSTSSNTQPTFQSSTTKTSSCSTLTRANGSTGVTQNEKNHTLFLIVYKFLQQQMNENQNLNAVQKESLEVVVQCLGYAFQFFEFDYVENNLQKIYDFFEKHKHDREKTETKEDEDDISPEDIVEADEYKEKGNKLMREEKFKEALEFYEKAVRLNPKEPALYCNRAAAYNNLNKFNEAVEDCNTAISLNGSYAKAYIRRGLAYEKLKDNKHALKSYKKAYQLEPENEHYKNLYMEASKRFKQKQDESTSTPGSSFNMFLGSNMSSLPFDHLPEFDNLMESLFSGVERQWQNQPPPNQRDQQDQQYNYYS